MKAEKSVSSLASLASLASFAFAGMAGALGYACVPPGNSTPSDAGAAAPTASITKEREIPSGPVMTAVFEDGFDRKPALGVASSADAALNAPGPSLDAALAATASNADGAARRLTTTDASRTVARVRLPDGSIVTRDLDAFLSNVDNTTDDDAGDDDTAGAGVNEVGPDWLPTDPRAWHLEKGRLCGSHARNHGIWLAKVLPVNARIEFDAVADTQEGDLKGEFWGDGHSYATSLSYTNASGYLAILGGWHNTFHVLARRNEHGTDRKEIHVDKTSDDPEEKPVEAGQVYRFKIERNDGKTVRFSVNGTEYLNYPDADPLKGGGHDHFGFNDWDAKVCFDNVKVTPLP